MEFVIEKNIPLPKRTRVSKYPFAGLKVGDSFLVPVEFVEDTPVVFRRMTAAKTVASAHLRKQRNGKTAFVVAEVADGVRIWRTE